MATLYKMLNGERIAMTDAETTARLAEEKAWNDGAFDRALEELRIKRNNKLSESDWMANSDVTMSSNWKTYRQELRDMTEGLDTIDKINNVTWPTEPS
tara:strand:- start:744 stop:1037 length:294 start_codon:yes stop_codon:yes gene_type:complete